MRSAPLPRYLVCNADESEPGTFKDRVILEGDPFALIEAMIIAGFATGSDKGYLYIRGEYPLATELLEHAIRRCYERGFLGAEHSGHRTCASTSSCGAAPAPTSAAKKRRFSTPSKAIAASRATSRLSRPRPASSASPRSINNVETLVNVLPILIEGGAAYASVGTERSTGTKLFCLSGHVKRPGVYEVPFGATLRELLELAGGIGGTGRLQAVLLGGAAGAFVTPDQI